MSQVIKQLDKERKKINILVYDKNITIINEKNIKSKDVICPKCGEICLITINNYKIKLNKCKYNHECNNILLNEFDNTQKINESKIICNNCNKNISKIYNNELYICCECKINLCPLCKLKHNKGHKLIEYNNKNYICNNHGESFISYCKNCNNNLCMLCEIEHDNNHEIISYKEIMPKKDNLIKKMTELKSIVNIFNKENNKMIEILEEVKNNIGNYYEINNNIINNYDIHYRNYQILTNINNINNDKIIKEINDVINENNIKNKYINIFNIYNEIKEKINDDK